MFGDLSSRKINDLCPVYIVLIRAGSFIPTFMRRSSHPYTHVSVSFESSMKHMYTFGNGLLTKAKYISVGSVNDNLKDIHSFSQKCKYSIYVTFIPVKDKEYLQNKLDKVSDTRGSKELRYKLVNQLYSDLPNVVNKDDQHLCNQIIRSIYGLYIGGIPTPPNINTSISDFRFVEIGTVGQFDQYRMVERVNRLFDIRLPDDDNGDIIGGHISIP